MRSKKWWLILILLSLSLPITTVAQDTTPFWQKSDTLNKKRRNAVYITEASAAAVTLLGLNKLWYADFPRTSFQTVNDNKEWLQLDKIGHVLSSYHIGKIGMEALDWAGESKKNQLLYGATLGFAFLTGVEILDGYSEEWGFSMGDFVANTAGTGLLIGQELLWDEQRINLKYSFHTTKYAAIRPALLGENFLQQTIKDYNGQTYWLSANLWSFNKEHKIPKWLNIALGYGGEGMLSGNRGTFTGVDNFEDKRYRQFYLSLDVDLSKIKTRSKLLKTLFSAINFIKIPAPTIEFNTIDKFKFHLIYF